jgi:hypothetical protein
MNNYIKTLTINFLSIFLICASLEHNALAQQSFLQYVYLNPKPNANFVSRDSKIVFKPGEVISSSSVTNDIVTASGSRSGRHTGTIVLANDKKTLIFTPSDSFADNETVQVKISRELKSSAGESIPGSTYTFHTCISNPLSNSIISSQLTEGTPFAPVKPKLEKTAALPGNYPKLVTNKLSSTAPGYLFLTFYPYLIIQDNDNIPIFYRYLNGYAYDFKIQNTGELTYFLYPITCCGLDKNYNIVHTYTTSDGFSPDVHDLKILPDGSYYIFGKRNVILDMSTIVSGGNPAAQLIDGALQKFDSSGNLLFEWDALENFNITDVDSHVDLTAAQIDFTHFNSIEIDRDSNLILSARNLDEITKINPSTGETIWRWGGKNNQFTFFNDNIGFSRQHDVRRLSNGNISLFDNGDYHSTPFSRMVEYQMDETKRTVTLVRKFSRDSTVYSPAEGSVQELANGGRLIGWGNVSSPAITEIDSNNSTVYELTAPIDEYRAYRFPWKTGVFTTSVDTINFERIAAGSSSKKYITIYNPQDSTITINEIYCKESDVFFTSTLLPITIQPKDSVTIPVFFAPTDSSTRIASFNLRINSTYNSYPQLIARQVILLGNLGANSISNNESVSSYSFSLSQNYPNPFNPKTRIQYSLPEALHVSMNVYNQLGQKVAILFEGDKEAGQYSINWNADQYASGVYFYELAAGNYRDVKKLILLK